MIVASLGLSPSATWWAWLFWIGLAACAGGVSIFIGLLLETLAEKDQFPTVGNFRLWKRRKRWGEIWVLIGVFIEILSTGAFAIKGELESRQTNSKINETKQIAVRANDMANTNALNIDLNTPNGQSLSKEWCMVENGNYVKALKIGPFQEGSYELEARFLINSPPVEDADLRAKTVTCWLSADAGHRIFSQEQVMGVNVNNVPQQVDTNNLFGKQIRVGFTPLDSYQPNCEQMQKFWMHVFNSNTFIVPVISRKITNIDACLDAGSSIKATRINWDEWRAGLK
jgi:hypothetical protein